LKQKTKSRQKQSAFCFSADKILPCRISISAAHKSSGKTTITWVCVAPCATRGLTVQAFKKGAGLHRSDLARVGQRSAELQPGFPHDAQGEILELFARHADSADIA
jgi:cobyrinic acid a,c-diamide synthase